MTMALVSDRGGRLDLEVVAGIDMRPVMLTLKQDSGAPLDLQGKALSVKCATRVIGGVGVDVGLVATVQGDGQGGQIRLTMPLAEIARMEAPSNSSAAPRIGADWSLAVVNQDTTIVPLLFGEIRVRAQ